MTDRNSESFVKTSIISFPFDQFGSAGSGAGARLLYDATREMHEDICREKQPCRGQAFRNRLQLQEIGFESPANLAGWREIGRKLAQAALRRSEFVFWFGGNHLSVLPVLESLDASVAPLRAAKARRGADSPIRNAIARKGSQREDANGILVIQFDAHLDIYNLSDCTTELSHGNFLLHAERPLPSIVHVGHRDLFLPDAHLRRHFQMVVSAQDLALESATALDRLQHAAGTAERIWLDIDCDVFDPSCFPATGQPLPFGLMPATFLCVLNAVWSDRVAGISLSEFQPARDRSDQSLELLMWLIEWVLLRRYE